MTFLSSYKWLQRVKSDKSYHFNNRLRLILNICKRIAEAQKTENFYQTFAKSATSFEKIF